MTDPAANSTLRLLHASDCHLGANFAPGRNEAAFEALVGAAHRWEVDGVVLVGDVFDTARVPDDTLAWAAEQLVRLDRPTVILPGNHDHWGPSSVYSRLDFAAACPQVHVLTAVDGAVIEIPALQLALWGRPVVDHVPSFRPLADLPPRPAARWCVALGHGLVVDGDGPTDRGSPIRSEDLAAITWDYVALGHWSTFWLVRSGPSPVCYAGPTSHHAEWPPGAVVVDFSVGHDAVVRRVPFDQDP